MNNEKTKNIVLASMFATISAVLMLVDFPLPFAPSFMKFDFSDVPLMIASYILGPVYAILVILLKIAIKLVFKPSSTAYIGEFANIISSICFVLPGSVIYSIDKTKKRAVFGLIIGTLTSSLILTFLNAVLLFPMYMNLYGMSESEILLMIQKVNSSVDSIFKAMLFSVLPFNIFKYGIASIITFFVYKNISNLIKKL